MSSEEYIRLNRIEFFFSNVTFTDVDGCWLWQRDTNTMKGMTGRITPYHFAYELIRGPKTRGLVFDHLCRVKRCCNPWHLEEVTNEENRKRGIVTRPTNVGAYRADRLKCNRGHDLSPENTRLTSNGRKRCLLCADERRAEAEERGRSFYGVDLKLSK